MTRDLICIYEGRVLAHGTARNIEEFICAEIPEMKPQMFEPHEFRQWLKDSEGWRLLKRAEELKPGELTVVCSNDKLFSGNYSGEHKCVFFAIPSNYEIIGYIQ